MIGNVCILILFKVGQKICINIIPKMELEVVDKNHGEITKHPVLGPLQLYVPFCGTPGEGELEKM
jgi:hypothetical protein